MKTSTDDRKINHDIMIENLTKDLVKAKRNTQTLLDEPEASVDFHSLGYWAQEVDRLRTLLKNNL